MAFPRKVCSRLVLPGFGGLIIGIFLSLAGVAPAFGSPTIEGHWMSSRDYDYKKWPPSIFAASPSWDLSHHRSFSSQFVGVCRVGAMIRGQFTITETIPGWLLFTDVSARKDVAGFSCAYSFSDATQAFPYTWDVLLPGPYHWAQPSEQSAGVIGGYVTTAGGGKVAVGICRVDDRPDMQLFPSGYDQVVGREINGHCYYQPHRGAKTFPGKPLATGTEDAVTDSYLSLRGN